jgi:hypothetical protein
VQKTVIGNIPQAKSGITTSSLCPTPRANSENRIAFRAEEHTMACFVPMYFATFFSILSRIELAVIA